MSTRPNRGRGRGGRWYGSPSQNTQNTPIQESTELPSSPAPNKGKQRATSERDASEASQSDAGEGPVSPEVANQTIKDQLLELRSLMREQSEENRLLRQQINELASSRSNSKRPTERRSMETTLNTNITERVRSRGQERQNTPITRLTSISPNRPIRDPDASARFTSHL